VTVVSEESLEFYQTNGYVVVPGLFDDASLERWRDRLDAVVSGAVEPAEGMLVMEDVMVARGAVKARTRNEAIAKIQDFENDPELYSYAEDERLLHCLEAFIGHDIFSIHTMLINKPPGVDGRHPLHQDLLYFPFRPADKIIATWTALEPATRENGCLVVLPGSHKGELLPHENVDWEFVNGGYWGAKGIGSDAERVYLEMDSGDTVFFHPILIHGSGRNRSDGPRRAISAHYGSMECTWEWSIEDFGRRYKVVRGERAGQWWRGERNVGEPIDPLKYIPVDAADPALAKAAKDHAKSG
jgi:phytanoyl-CoA hydroxylase